MKYDTEVAPSAKIHARIRRLANELGMKQWEVQELALDLFEDKKRAAMREYMRAGIAPQPEEPAKPKPRVIVQTNGRASAPTEKPDTPRAGYECERCGKVCRNLAGLKLHVQRKHSNTSNPLPTTRCPWCEEEITAWGASFDQHEAGCRAKYEAATKPAAARSGEGE